MSWEAANESINNDMREVDVSITYTVR